MSKPRTTAQRYADYKRTFPRKINDRRCELIDKELSGFAEEEGSRRLDLDPAWREEFDRRCRANLTDAERAELAECTKIVDEWQERSPWAIDQRTFMDEQETRLEALMERIKARKGAGSD